MALTTRERVLEAVHEQRAVGEVRERVVERLLPETVAEARVLHCDAGLCCEGVEEMEVVSVERADITQAVRHHQGSEQHALTLQQRRHRVAIPLVAKPCAQLWIRR